ncbi:outer membrane lipoprotein-sorting protein [Thalassotalea sp. M1531]|uniref:Outer membrane lipoprotein-sorting protein n=1 Tax=Thalassotalea algicola TaxID=2716224 RepID=A0A7Y0LDL3_9GAMM|nr:outer membrane lipoprotein-sorting protein [Thalassotalea algicola]NMP32332.1 outer membrane lipoprotein-sorting protein [Thalassotalea algicola]
MNSFISKLALVYCLSQMSFGYAEESLTAQQIINKSNLASYYAGNDGRAQARMVIVDGKGQKQIRQFTILRKDIEDLGDQQMMVFFSRPTDVKGTVFRVNKKINSDDERWLYLPALDLVKRISAGDKRTSFVGSNFYYEDVSGRNPQEDNLTLLTSNEDNKHYLLKGQPKSPESVEFSYYQAKIDKKTFMPVNVVYFDQTGSKLREMKVLKMKNVQGHPTVVHSRIHQFSDNSYTDLQFRGVAYDVGLPSTVFTERSLRTVPKKWLK